MGNRDAGLVLLGMCMAFVLLWRACDAGADDYSNRRAYVKCLNELAEVR